MAYYYGSSLSHHGILGQKWGVRRYQNPDGTLTDAGKRRYSNVLPGENGVKLMERSGKNKGFYDIYDQHDKVGRAIVETHRGNAHLDWIGIRQKYRRKGIGQSALNSLIAYYAKEGMKSMTLEAAGLDPAAMHIYEKMGFEVIKNIDSDIWNGLTLMKKDL